MTEPSIFPAEIFGAKTLEDSTHGPLSGISVFHPSPKIGAVAERLLAHPPPALSASLRPNRLSDLGL